MADPVQEVKTTVTTEVAKVETAVKVDAVKMENSVVTFVKNLWGDIETADVALNKWVSSVTQGYTTLALVVVAVLYWLLPIKAILDFILTIPAWLVKTLLDGAAWLIPTLIGAIPYIIGIVLVLLAVVEVIAAIKKLVK
jgi:hypothetical protein